MSANDNEILPVDIEQIAAAGGAFVELHRKLREAGFTDAIIGEGLLVEAVGVLVLIYGQRNVAQRLFLLADTLANDAVPPDATIQ